MFAELLVSKGRAAKANDLESFWSTALAEQIKQRRDQLALCQITGCAEDDDRCQ